uniref:Zinc knuckle CX2CX4HX4C n=1 Tax=Tanacetum cinerariifolium TaxID=118510 RepID=A0A6L2J2F0_TANCI|nr:zinc knuckle CX2CX4HX4C [Tanacetum cinerariifolium]
MATTSKLDSTHKDKGKMIITEPEITAMSDLRPIHCNKIIEAVVYRYLYDPIQRNIDVKDADYFNQLLQHRKAYRIFSFSYDQTGLWEGTLDNPISLIFGRFIDVKEIPSDDYPEHYFNFASYNELPARPNMKHTILTVSEQMARGYYLCSRMVFKNEFLLPISVSFILTRQRFEVVAKSEQGAVAVVKCAGRRFYGLQCHPELAPAISPFIMQRDDIGATVADSTDVAHDVSHIVLTEPRVEFIDAYQSPRSRVRANQLVNSILTATKLFEFVISKKLAFSRALKPYLIRGSLGNASTLSNSRARPIVNDFANNPGMIGVKVGYKGKTKDAESIVIKMKPIGMWLNLITLEAMIDGYLRFLYGCEGQEDMIKIKEGAYAFMCQDCRVQLHSMSKTNEIGFSQDLSLHLLARSFIADPLIISLLELYLADNTNTHVTPCKVSHVDDSINLNVNDSIMPSDPIVQSVDINTTSTSYAGVAGTHAKDQPKFKVNSNFRPLVADLVFDGVNIFIPRKVVEKVGTRFEHTLYGYFIGKRMAFLVVEYYARNNKAKHGLKSIMMNYKGFFFLKFDSRAGLEVVLEGGPWSSFARCLIEVNSDADLMDVVTIGVPSLTGNDFTKKTIRVEYEWRPPRCDICKIFGHVHDHFPKKVAIPSIVTTSNGVTPSVEKANDGFQTVGKKKKKKGKSKSTNGGQFVGLMVKQNVRYEPKATTSAPNKGPANVGDTPKKGANIGPSSKTNNIPTSNLYSTLNVGKEDEEEVVENVYDESANLFTDTNIGGSSCFTVAAG